MPDPPDKRHQHNALQFPQRKGGADHDQKNRRTNEAPSEPLEQRAVAIGANHSRQMMAHCAERSDKKIDVLRTPETLHCDENRNQ
jgi:hypothetical protein